MNMQETAGRARAGKEEGGHAGHGPLRGVYPERSEWAQGDGRRAKLVQLIRHRGDPGIEIVDVQRGALAFD